MGVPCTCSPCLKRLMGIFAARGHINSGCCGDEAHQARKSDHNPDASGYAHAQDIHERLDHDMQPFVAYIMANPRKFPQVKYLIYESRIHFPHPGSRPAGSYAYTGPNAHASHLHVSIFAGTQHHAGSWFVDEAYGATPEPASEEDEVKPYVVRNTDTGHYYVVAADSYLWVSQGPGSSLVQAFGPALDVDNAQHDIYKAGLNPDVDAAVPAA